MTRPASYDDSLPINRCGTCLHCHYVAYHGHLLCFYGDTILARREGQGTWDRSFIEMNGDSVELLEGDAYDKVWCGRIVDNGDTCDEWERRGEAQRTD